MSIKSDSLAYGVLAFQAADIKHHLKSDFLEWNLLIGIPASKALALALVELGYVAFRRVPVFWIVKVVSSSCC